MTATDDRSQGGEAQPATVQGKVLVGRWKWQLGMCGSSFPTPWFAVTLVHMGAAAATSPPWEEGQQPPAWWLVWESSSHHAPAKQTGSRQPHIGSQAPSCWVAGTRRENKIPQSQTASPPGAKPSSPTLFGKGMFVASSVSLPFHHCCCAYANSVSKRTRGPL